MRIKIGPLKIPLSDVVSIGPADPREVKGFGLDVAFDPSQPPPVQPPKTRVVYMLGPTQWVAHSTESVPAVLASIVP